MNTSAHICHCFLACTHHTTRWVGPPYGLSPQGAQTTHTSSDAKQMVYNGLELRSRPHATRVRAYRAAHALCNVLGTLIVYCLLVFFSLSLSLSLYACIQYNTIDLLCLGMFSNVLEFSACRVRRRSTNSRPTCMFVLVVPQFSLTFSFSLCTCMHMIPQPRVFGTFFLTNVTTNGHHERAGTFCTCCASVHGWPTLDHTFQQRVFNPLVQHAHSTEKLWNVVCGSPCGGHSRNK